ncbi:TPA: hypothetical protein QDB04_000210 [Burkholderia vietnamiensis]|nr:hypothetical protein [Burkholderia vietnamiensis]
MITSLFTSLSRVLLFWYFIGGCVLGFGAPSWAEAAYRRLEVYPWVPIINMDGLWTAAAVQWRLLLYWSLPMVIVWAVSVGLGVLAAEVKCQLELRRRRLNLKPTGMFWGVTVPSYSLGRLPDATTPKLSGQAVTLSSDPAASKKSARVELEGVMKEAVKTLTPAERQLSEELLQLLLAAPDHYAGLGHGVGLLEHTLNVVSEAAAKVTPEFRMPLLAALSHDVGKLITFQPDGKGGWKKRGLHSRESARILATLPAFQELPELHQRALLLAVKYDHAPNKMPELRGEREACTLAMRTISALAHADRKATADEKERHLERLQPEDLLWKDFVDYLREAPVVQRGKKGVANQVNNPPDSPYLYLYEAPWRDAAVRRLPAEVAAALDLTRRDAGKMAKYTRILVERLRKEGVLVETYQSIDKDGVVETLKVSETNPLWDIQSGTGEKAVVLRGILVLQADALWKKLNYRISVKSPFPVQILAPNANADGRVNEAPRANKDEPRTPEVSDGLKLADVQSEDAMASLGLTGDVAADTSKPAAKPKTRGRGGFKSAPAVSQADESMFGLKSGAQAAKPPSADTKKPEHAPEVASEQPDQPQDEEVLTDAEAQERAELEAAMAESTPAAEPEENVGSSVALQNAMAYLVPSSPAEEPASNSDEPVAAEPEPASEPEARQAESPKADKKTPAAPQHEKAAAMPAPATSGTEAVVELSRAEKREGLAVADEAAVAKFPGLKLGEKYYTEHSRAVQAGLKKPGSRYKGDNKEKSLELTEGGPRRGRRRLTS